jgi:hypothetical protein
MSGAVAKPDHHAPYLRNLPELFLTVDLMSMLLLESTLPLNESVGNERRGEWTK